MKKLTLKEEFRLAILSAVHDEGLDISDAIDSAFEAVIQPVLGSYPDDEKPTLKELKAALLDAPKYELDKIYVQAKTLRQPPRTKREGALG